MRYFFTAVTACMIAFSATAQTSAKNNDAKAMANQAGDHVMLQLAANFYDGFPDSISSFVKGFNRSVNAYIMFDKRFKTNPKLSAAFGAGVGTANVYFDKMRVLIGDKSGNLPFIRTDTGSSYSKYKLALAYLEAPIELRFTAKPETPNKSLKFALGLKVGTLLNAHTKAKELESAAGASISGSTVKESNKNYFNGTRVAGTLRVGYGIVTAFGSYNITNIFKDAVAPETRLLQVGITISGL